MPRVPFAKQSYNLRSRPETCERLINLYAEQAPADALSPVVIKSTPGLRPEFLVGPGPIYAMASMPGRLYIISGTEVILAESRRDGSETRITIGTIPATDLPTIAVGPTQVVVCAPPTVWVATHGQPLQQVDGSQMPSAGASAVVYLDGYFVFTAYDGNNFFCSDLLDGTRFDGLDFATSEDRPDYVQFLKAHRDDLWLFGQDATAVFYNAGGPSFPFVPRPGAVIEQGCGSYASVAQIDGSLWWLGRDRIVYRSQGYQAVRVSTHAIEEVLSDYGDIRSCEAFGFVWEGHSFYALALPSAPDGATSLVYDCATQLWHERQTEGKGRWRAARACQYGPYLLIGDAFLGVVHRMDASVPTEGNSPVLRQATLPPINAGDGRGFMARVELEMETGTGAGAVFLDWSDDGGVAFRPGRLLATGAAGDPAARRRRVYTTRLGSFRQRVLRFSATAPVTLYAAMVEMQVEPAYGSTGAGAT